MNLNMRIKRLEIDLQSDPEPEPEPRQPRASQSNPAGRVRISVELELAQQVVPCLARVSRILHGPFKLNPRDGILMRPIVLLDLSICDSPQSFQSTKHLTHRAVTRSYSSDPILLVFI